jgi:hypothetical protein
MWLATARTTVNFETIIFYLPNNDQQLAISDRLNNDRSFSVSRNVSGTNQSQFGVPSYLSSFRLFLRFFGKNNCEYNDNATAQWILFLHNLLVSLRSSSQKQGTPEQPLPARTGLIIHS